MTGALVVLATVVAGLLYEQATAAHASIFETLGIMPMAQQASPTPSTAPMIAGTMPAPQPTATMTAAGNQGMNQDVTVSALFSFGDGRTDGWRGQGRHIADVENSTAHAMDGTHSLRIKLDGLTATADAAVAVSTNIQAAGGQALSLYIYRPQNTGAVLARPFTLDQHAQAIGAANFVRLAVGWNRLMHVLPANFSGRVTVVGVQFMASADAASGQKTVSGSIYLDAVTWDKPAAPPPTQPTQAAQAAQATQPAQAAATTAASGVVIRTATLQHAGKPQTVLTDAQGKVLYYYILDTATSVMCTGACAQTWPPLLAPSGMPTSATALPGQLGVVSGANGQQVTYNGHPLYTYTQDMAPGEAYGQGVGGTWYIATIDLPVQSASSAANAYNG